VIILQLSKDFTLEEFRCPCCNATPDPESLEFKYFVGKLQEIRDMCRFPLKITSGFRCVKHNKKVGGEKDSSHLLGIAVDIAINNDYTRLAFLSSAIQVGIKRIGIAKTYIHVDIDDGKDNAVWLY
jgi:zinc D-Ala-D-Ala carboxypeptidase